MRFLQILRLFIIPCILILASSCTKNNETIFTASPLWTLVYKNSHNGETLYGSKEELIYALRSGSPLRVGFGGHREGDTLRSIEHLADAEFISIANSKEVFAQISTVIGQRPNLDEKPYSMEFHEDRKFSMIASTNGSTSSLTIDFVIDTLHNTNTVNRGFSWYVQQATHMTNGDQREPPPVEPLWKNPRKR